MPDVIYGGPTSRSDPSTEFIVDKVRLVKDVPTEVSDELAEELLGGNSDRLKGHKFSLAEADDADAAQASDTAAGDQEALGGGSGGSQGTARGTARGRART